MELTLNEKMKVIKLSEKASDLLIKILEKPNSPKNISTEEDFKFKEAILKINKICPLLYEGYFKMYKYIK